MLLMLFFAGLNLCFSVWQISSFRDTRALEIFNFQSATLLSCFEKGNRSTFYLCTDSIPDPYLLEYVGSLKRQPYRSDRHTVKRIFPEDSLTGVRCHRLQQGLWSVYLNDTKVLIAGACEHASLYTVLDLYPWDVVLFKRGISWLEDNSGKLQPGTIVVGDGTLRNFEVKRIRELFPRAWITSKEGAWQRSTESRSPFSIH